LQASDGIGGDVRFGVVPIALSVSNSTVRNDAGPGGLDNCAGKFSLLDAYHRCANQPDGSLYRATSAQKLDADHDCYACPSHLELK
jgi:hypothetical protein